MIDLGDDIMRQSVTADAILDHMSDLLFVMSVDPNRQFRYARMNPAAMKETGLDEYAYGATFQDVVTDSEAQILQSEYTRAYHLRRPVVLVMNHDGRIGESLLSPIVGGSGLVTHIVTTVRDVTDRYTREKQLVRQANQDALTGLLNRRGLVCELEKRADAFQGQSSVYSVFLIDVDDFKRINDTYGHMIGDLYLQHVAQRLELAVREEDLVSRFGGDEFVILAKTENAMDTESIAMRIQQSFDTPWTHHGLAMDTRLSIGIATYPVDGMTIWDVVEAADRALYKAKHAGGGRYLFTR